MSSRQNVIPSIDEISATVYSTFRFQPCPWQIRSARAQLEAKDVITISPTGSGKTLCFWIPLLFHNRVMILITPLNILGDKNVDELKDINIPAICLKAKSATDKAFKDIAAAKYRVIIVSPERVLSDKRFDILWAN
ncbi:hypothetical protein SERLADRAFT_433958 [Serpula lacrymans var. lacrymans S7.9]|uniref:DNA 3'-5' helicase n=1 Tax=Serpula lacrymans var. lacrymans (strain S7.9) TaxID=578457 RepID=F8NJH6_SERL9|nr:uncharacterized protein SERLADRAFT_433958 [Serpula lacrymans var. lacrymans S7.9]EGO30026.1 hypothetical protein SERLADRAFT_433958 [Serpula lacrymans var. lacrymans S7.9]